MKNAFAENLIDELREMGIADERVLQAIANVPREKFVPPELQHRAYENVPLPIGSGQTISQPYTVAFMTELLNVQPGDKILEIGTGSGYQAAVLAELGAIVYSVERTLDIYNRTLNLLDNFNYKIIMKYGDGTIGWNEYAPYDKIIVTAGSPQIPEALKKQLKTGGRMVIPVGNRNSQKMVLLVKNSDDDFEIKEFPNFRFVPLIGKNGWKEE